MSRRHGRIRRRDHSAAPRPRPDSRGGLDSRASAFRVRLIRDLVTHLLAIPNEGRPPDGNGGGGGRAGAGRALLG